MPFVDVSSRADSPSYYDPPLVSESRHTAHKFLLLDSLIHFKCVYLFVQLRKFTHVQGTCCFELESLLVATRSSGKLCERAYNPTGTEPLCYIYYLYPRANSVDCCR
jgi:hypothetical protein